VGARLSEETEKPQRQLEALHVLARALAAGEFRAHTVLERACSAVAGGFGFERVGIVRYVPATRVLIPFVEHGLTDAEREALPASLPIAHFSAFERALSTGRATFVGDPSEERTLPAEVERAFGIGSFVLVPLLSEGRCLGFMTCDLRGDRFTLTENEIDLLGTFGALIGAFLERAIQHAELRRLNELRSQFVAIASHEQRAELGQTLAQQAKRLYELVENLLDLSRLEADALRIRPTEIHLQTKLSEIARSVLEPGQTVDIEVAADLRPVVDPEALEHIVSISSSTQLVTARPRSR